MKWANRGASCVLYIVYGVILLAAGCARTPPEAVPASAPTPGAAAARLAAELDGLSLDDFFDASFRALTLRSPETVVEAGLTNIYGVTNVALDDISDAYVQETYALTAVILDALESYDRAALSPEQQISYDVYRWYLQDRLAGQPFHQYEYPATYFQSTAVHESLRLFFTDIHPVRSLQDARDYVARLRLVDAKIEQLIAELDARAAAGLTPPAFAVDWAFYSSLHGLIRAGATATPFYTNLATKVAALPDASAAEKEALLADAETAVETAVLPAYQKLYDYLRDMPVYTGAASGVWRLPDGDAYYAYRLRHYTTTDLTADEIHALGLAELDRIHGAMRAVFDELGYPADESLVQLFDRVARDGGHVAGAEVLATYEALIAAASRDAAAAFDLRPQTDVVVIADEYGGFYVPGAVDGSRPGAFYAGVGGSGEAAYAMPTLAYHEAIPGHHFQIALAQEMRHLPAFRQALTFTAYTEGWALYAEQLADELGWYADDPYGRLGMLQAQAFRAARLVVDTGLHAEGWTFAEAQAFFTANTGFAVGDSVNPEHQIGRYLVWPGQATAYYVGFLQILALREDARAQLGSCFDLKAFHRAVLSSGSMPLEILAQVVADYVAASECSP